MNIRIYGLGVAVLLVPIVGLCAFSAARVPLKNAIFGSNVVPQSLADFSGGADQLTMGETAVALIDTTPIGFYEDLGKFQIAISGNKSSGLSVTYKKL